MSDNDRGFLLWIAQAAECGWPVHRLAVERLRRLANWPDIMLPAAWMGNLDRNETLGIVRAARARYGEPNA
jgi:hypothetical protein